MKRTFVYNGKKFDSMMAIAREMGVKRIYTRDFDKYGIVEIVNDANDANDVNDVNDSTDVAVDAAEETKAEEPKKDKRFTKKCGNAEEVAEAIKLAKGSDIEAFAKYVKHFTAAAMAEVAKAVDVPNMWETISNEPIRKMRLIMEVKATCFPGEKVYVKPVTEWNKVTINKLAKAAEDNGLGVKHYDDERIYRMFLTRALNEAGVSAEDYIEKPDTKGEVVDAPTNNDSNTDDGMGKVA